MADNAIANNNGSPVTFATDDIGAGVQSPRMKLMLGSDGVDDGNVSSANPLPVSITGGTLDTLIDVASSSITYVCEAQIGSATNSAVWRIARHTISGTVTIIRYAGIGEFDQIADDRASLTYA